jgi:cytochrome c
MRAVVAWLVAGLVLCSVPSARADDLEQRLASANLKRGQLLFMTCKACHDLEPAQPPKAGPGLEGVFGRKAGTLPGFKYSDALVKSGIAWTPGTMDTWLRQPGAMVPGNGMAFPGIASDADRASLIAYLMSATAGK